MHDNKPLDPDISRGNPLTRANTDCAIPVTKRTAIQVAPEQAQSRQTDPFLPINPPPPDSGNPIGDGPESDLSFEVTDPQIRKALESHAPRKRAGPFTQDLGEVNAAVKKQKTDIAVSQEANQRHSIENEITDSYALPEKQYQETPAPPLASTDSPDIAQVHSKTLPLPETAPQSWESDKPRHNERLSSQLPSLCKNAEEEDYDDTADEDNLHPAHFALVSLNFAGYSDHYVKPPQFNSAQDQLERTHLVVLKGPKGYGQRIGAVQLLRQERNRRIQELYPATSPQDLHPNCQSEAFLIGPIPLENCAQFTPQELQRLSEHLISQDCYMVILVHRDSALPEAEDNLFLVDWEQLPPRTQMLECSLKRLGSHLAIESLMEAFSKPPFKALLQDTHLLFNEVERLAALLSRLDSLDNMERILDQFEASVRREIEQWFEHNTLVEDRALMIAVACLSELPLDTVFAGYDRLVNIARPHFPNSPINPSNTQTTAVRLAGVGAASYQGSRNSILGSTAVECVRSNKSAYKQAVIEYVWNNLQPWRRLILTWITSLSQQATTNGNDEVRRRLVLLCLNLSNLDIAAIYTDVLMPWAADPNPVSRQAAIDFVVAASRRSESSDMARKFVHGWSIGQDSPWLALTAAKAFSTSLGPHFAKDALKDLKLISTLITMTPERFEERMESWGVDFDMSKWRDKLTRSVERALCEIFKPANGRGRPDLVLSRLRDWCRNAQKGTAARQLYLRFFIKLTSLTFVPGGSSHKVPLILVRGTRNKGLENCLRGLIWAARAESDTENAIQAWLDQWRNGRGLNDTERKFLSQFPSSQVPRSVGVNSQDPSYTTSSASHPTKEQKANNTDPSHQTGKVRQPSTPHTVGSSIPEPPYISQALEEEPKLHTQASSDLNAFTAKPSGPEPGETSKNTSPWHPQASTNTGALPSFQGDKTSPVEMPMASTTSDEITHENTKQKAMGGSRAPMLMVALILVAIVCATASYLAFIDPKEPLNTASNQPSLIQENALQEAPKAQILTTTQSAEEDTTIQSPSSATTSKKVKTKPTSKHSRSSKGTGRTVTKTGDRVRTTSSKAGRTKKTDKRSSR